MMLLLAWGLLWWQAATPPPTPVDVTAITGALRTRNFADARQLTKAALERTPNDYRLWTLQALAEEGSGDINAALADYGEALKRSGKYLPALKGKAQIEYKTGSKDAKQTLERILRLQPEDLVSHAMLGAIAFKAGDCEGTIANYRASLQLIRSEASAMTQYGQCLIRRGQPGEAVEPLEQAARLTPTDWVPRFNLAVAQLASKEPQKSLETLAPLMGGANAQPKVLELASASYEEAGDTPKAVETLRQAIVLSPKDESLCLDFVNLSFTHRSFPVGVEMVSAGLTQLPDSAKLYAARGVLHVQMAKYELAEADFAKAAEIDPNQSFSSVAEGLTQLEQTNFDQALTTTEAQIRKNPTDAFLYYLKAETLKRKAVQPGTGAFVEAVRAAEQAVKLKPDFSLAQDLLGSFYLQQGKLEAARRTFEAVLQHEPNQQSALYHLIVTERRSNHPEKVAPALKRLAEAKAEAQRADAKASKYQLVDSKAGDQAQ